MNILAAPAEQIRLFWRFLGFFQKPGPRLLHATIAGLVISQIGSSALMGSSPGVSAWIGWYHKCGGAVLCVLAPLWAIKSLHARGARHFFPYVWADTAQLRQDCKRLLRGETLPPRPRGLGAVVQGLGLVLLTCTAYVGLSWFVLRSAGYPNAYIILGIHANLALCVVGYVVVHGALGLYVFRAWRKMAGTGEKTS